MNKDAAVWEPSHALQPGTSTDMAAPPGTWQVDSGEQTFEGLEVAFDPGMGQGKSEFWMESEWGYDAAGAWMPDASGAWNISGCLDYDYDYDAGMESWTGGGTENEGVVPQRLPHKLPEDVCWDWAKLGHCPRGADCLWRHINSVEEIDEIPEHGVGQATLSDGPYDGDRVTEFIPHSGENRKGGKGGNKGGKKGKDGKEERWKDGLFGRPGKGGKEGKKDRSPPQHSPASLDWPSAEHRAPPGFNRLPAKASPEQKQITSTPAMHQHKGESMNGKGKKGNRHEAEVVVSLDEFGPTDLKEWPRMSGASWADEEISPDDEKLLVNTSGTRPQSRVVLGQGGSRMFRLAKQSIAGK